MELTQTIPNPQNSVKAEPRYNGCLIVIDGIGVWLYWEAKTDLTDTDPDGDHC